jgi:hypothetical protein
MMINGNSLTVIQLNDSHAYFDLHQEMFWQGGKAVYRPAGGYARIATLVKCRYGARGLHRYTAFTKGQDVVIHDIQVNELVERAFAKMGTVRPPRLGDITLQGKD